MHFHHYFLAYCVYFSITQKQQTQALLIHHVFRNHVLLSFHIKFLLTHFAKNNLKTDKRVCKL